MLDSFLHYLLYNPKEPMLFNSGIFLVIFTIFLSIYAFIYENRKIRTVYILLFSTYFYYKSSGIYLIILLLTILIDYYLALLIYNTKEARLKKIYLVLSICSSVGLLGYFKYTNFFLQNINLFLTQPLAEMNIFLPIGISFYTFQTLSYIIDVYRGKIIPHYSLLDYSFFMTFFPHLVAGPIVRAADFLPQVGSKLNIQSDRIYDGLVMILKGLIKKAILADYIAQYNDIIFSNPGGYSGFENLIAMYGYTLQIYCDFSGYSDMAIGLARIMGFELAPNFDLPYRSTNISQFWRKWHMSLSFWLRDYIYIPMGGNRKGEIAQYLFLFLTMLIGGLWHGPSWKFVFWGGMHGIGLIIHKLWQKYTGGQKGLIAQWIGGVLTFHFVAFLWVYFRAPDFTTASTIIFRIFTTMDFAYILPFIETRPLFCILLLSGFIFHFIPLQFKLKTYDWFIHSPWVVKTAILLLIFQCIIQLQGEGVQPFIYFQF